MVQCTASRRRSSSPYFPAMEEILVRCSLKKDDLKSECPREILTKIALKITDWKVFGNILSIPKETIKSIEVGNGTEEQRRIAILNSWHERESRSATSFILAEKLYEHDRRDLVTELCELVKSSTEQEARLSDPKPSASMVRLGNDVSAASTGKTNVRLITDREA